MMDDPADCDPARGPEHTAAPLAECPPSVLPASLLPPPQRRGTEGAAVPENPAQNRASGLRGNLNTINRFGFHGEGLRSFTYPWKNGKFSFSGPR